MFIRKKTLQELQTKIYFLEKHANADYEKLKKDFERLEKLEHAVWPEEGFGGLYALMNASMEESIWGTKPPKKKPTYTSILEEKFEAALKALGIDVVKKSATDEKFVAKKVVEPKKGKK